MVVASFSYTTSRMTGNFEDGSSLVCSEGMYKITDSVQYVGTDCLSLSLHFKRYNNLPTLSFMT